MISFWQQSGPTYPTDKGITVELVIRRTAYPMEKISVAISSTEIEMFLMPRSAGIVYNQGEELRIGKERRAVANQISDMLVYYFEREDSDHNHYLRQRGAARE